MIRFGNYHIRFTMRKISIILDEFHKETQKIVKSSKDIHIVNAGRMNSGKSSLLNSLLGEAAFKVADIRETRENKEALFDNNVYLVDTPGLDAEVLDDQTAYGAYHNANCILFLHSVKIGEFHKNEFEALNKLERILGKEYFWKHVIFVLTFVEEYELVQLTKIKNKIETNIKERFQVPQLHLFEVSNKRYDRAMNETDAVKKGQFLKVSGIPELLQYINYNKQTWKKEISQWQKNRFNKIKQENHQELSAHKEAANKKNSQREQDIKRKMDYSEKHFAAVQANIDRVYNEWHAHDIKVRNLERELQSI